MKTAVRYYTRSGNTKKLAESIAAAVGAEAKTVSEPLEEKIDALFLGSSVYAGGADSSVIKFIADNKDKIGCIYNFSTAFLPVSTYKKVCAAAKANGVEVSENEFHCKGSFMGMNKNRPDENDLKAAAEFAKNAVKDV